MIDYARPYEHANMCDMYYPPTPPAPARLNDFDKVFRKGNTSHIYGTYYSMPSYDVYAEPDMDGSRIVYHDMVSRREPYEPYEEWKKKPVHEWSEDDSAAWVYDAVRCLGVSDFEVPYHSFRMSGLELRNLKREDIQVMMARLSMDGALSRRIADTVFEKLHTRLNDDLMTSTYDRSMMYRYVENAAAEPYSDHVQTVLDLDSIDHKHTLFGVSDYRPNDSRLLACDSSDDTEDVFRSSGNASPGSYGSDASKSGDEEDKRKLAKRPPGRPKGSGRKMVKRPRSVSVPEFLRNLLLDPKYCPSIIKWEDHSLGKFRFVKPDDVAKLWGKMKQNDNMTFEKFSRAMRYHYRQAVLVSVPTARLVYQFGVRGPEFKTNNPNFTMIKTELDMAEYA